MNKKKITSILTGLMLMLSGCTASTDEADTTSVSENEQTEELTSGDESMQTDEAETDKDDKDTENSSEASDKEQDGEDVQVSHADGTIEDSSDSSEEKAAAVSEAQQTTEETQFVNLAFALPEGYTQSDSSDTANGDSLTSVSYNNEAGALIMLVYDEPLPTDQEEYGTEFSTEASAIAQAFVEMLGSDYTIDTPTVQQIGQDQFPCITYTYTVTQDDGEVLDGEVYVVDNDYNLYAVYFAKHVDDGETEAFEQMVSSLHAAD